MRLAIPKGRLEAKTVTLLAEVGVRVAVEERSYRPASDADDLEVKMFKPQNIPAIVALGSADAGFTGHDWVRETGAAVIEVLDLGFDPVRVVAAAAAPDLDSLRGRAIVAASEYERLTRGFLEAQGFEYTFLRSYGATEVFPPEDADLIVDNVSTGQTLRSHGLHEVAEVLRSTTRFIASPAAMRDPALRGRIEALADLMRAVLRARERVLLEMNVPADRLDAVVAEVPCMKSPTVSPLYGGGGYAVKVAVPRREVPQIVLRLKALGATDILEYDLNKIVL